MENAIQPLLHALTESGNLTYDQSARAFQIIMNGGATPAQMAAFLTGLRLKGETPEEIAGAAAAMRAKAARFHSVPGALDTCGTGGDGSNSINISTGVAIVAAACGVPVVKHGNRAVSSRAGSADVLEQLGVKIDAGAPLMERALKECNLCFLFAPRYHPAMRHVAPVRQELGLRTIFNLLGPLSNPAQPDYQLLGVYAPHWVEPMAHVLKQLGVKRAWVVHGGQGEDELSLAGPSTVAELKDGAVTRFQVSPEDAGLASAPPAALAGGDAMHNAKLLHAVLAGEKGPVRDAILLNAAAALIIAAKAPGLREGADLAASAIDDGHAYTTLQKLVHISRS